MPTGNESKQQLKDLLEPVDALLEELDDPALKKSHRSVLVSFEQMLFFIERNIENRIHPDPKIDVNGREMRRLLTVYCEMARKFYPKYEHFLLSEIKNRRATGRVINKLIASQTDPDREHLQKALDDAVARDQDLSKNFPALLQDGLDKLRDEWQHVQTIVAGSELLEGPSNFMTSLRIVVEAVAYSVGLEGRRIIIVPGASFSLSFFKYLDNFAVLSVPFNSVQAPWDWTVFWHELAGYQVREVEKETILLTIENNLRDFYAEYRKLTTTSEKDAALEPVTRNNEFGRAYLKNVVFQGEAPDLSGLGSFEYQFERILSYLPEKDKFKIYDTVRAEGWNADWFKELFEDAYSVLAIGANFLKTFEDILRRHSISDDRHPPLKVRLKVTESLLKDPASHPDPGTMELKTDEDIRNLMIEAVAQQILKFLPLVNFAHHTHPQKTDSSTKTQAMDALFTSVKKTINSSIEEWKRAVEQGGVNLQNINNMTNVAIAKLSSDTAAEWRTISRSIPESTQNYDEMLKDIDDYEELLALSFHFTDDAVASVREVYYNGDKRFDTARLRNIPARVAQGAISYKISDRTRSTSKERWNTAAVEGFKIS